MSNGYQGQIRAIDQSGQKFSSNSDLFSLIKSSIENQNIKIIRLAIQDFPTPYAPIEPGNPSSTFSVKVGKNQNDYETIQVGFNCMYEINNVEITYLQAASDSSNRIIIDYIAQEVSN